MSAKPEHYDVIRKPVITEKATMVSENGAIVFEVDIEANKPQIKEAVETLFGVKVKAVNTTITKGKQKRFRGMLGRRKDVKKAYVTLEEGNTIDVTTGLCSSLTALPKVPDGAGAFWFGGGVFDKPASSERDAFLTGV